MNFAEIAKKSKGKPGLGYATFAAVALMGDILVDTLLLPPTLFLPRVVVQAASPALASGLYRLGKFVNQAHYEQSPKN